MNTPRVSAGLKLANKAVLNTTISRQPNRRIASTTSAYCTRVSRA